jgi:cell division protein FtsL
MTPPATAAANGHRSRTLRRGTAPRAPRRVSGPTRPPRAALAGGGAAVARPPLGMRLGHRAMRIGDARVLDRLVRGRAWIAIVAAALIGIVFMQVSMLKLNAGVSRAVTAADTLERQNATLRADISKLGSGERVQDAAAKQGMVTPAAGDVHYLNAEGVSAARAAASIKAPNPVALAPATATTPSGTAAAATTSGATATGAATTGTGAAATAAATNGATATGAAATGTTAQNGAATAQQAPTTQQQTPTAQNGAATANGATSTPTTQQTAPPATGTTSQAGSVAGGATATTPGEG